MTEEKGIPYQSKEWVQKAVEMTNEDEKFKKGGKKMDAISAYVITNCPDGTDRFTMYKFEKGVCVDWAWESRPHPHTDYSEFPFVKQAAFVTVAPYDFMCKVNRKEIGPFKVMTSKEMKILGSKPKLLSLIKPFSIWQDILSRVPTEY